MKICAVICEYDPFHNGHAYLLETAKAQTGCDKLLCLMSGNFTQRGEAAVAEKHVRARHAVACGADIVLELPVPFAVAPAELFARGAVRLLSRIPAVCHLAFGCESGTKEDFLALAALGEDETFKADLKENMKGGVSYIRARHAALLAREPQLGEALLTPNNILGAEYCRALRAEGSSIEPLPVLRRGGGHGDDILSGEYPSSSAIRAALGDFEKNRAALQTAVPASVFADFPLAAPAAYKPAALCALAAAPAERVAACTDCAEGVENRLKSLAAACPDYDALVESAASKRYTRARIRRILAQNFLGITKHDAHALLQAPLSCNVLAVKRDGADGLLSALAEGGLPVLVKAGEFYGNANADLRASELYAALTGVAADPSALFV